MSFDTELESRLDSINDAMAVDPSSAATPDWAVDAAYSAFSQNDLVPVDQAEKRVALSRYQAYARSGDPMDMMDDISREWNEERAKGRDAAIAFARKHGESVFNVFEEPNQSESKTRKRLSSLLGEDERDEYLSLGDAMDRIEQAERLASYGGSKLRARHARERGLAGPAPTQEQLDAEREERIFKATGLTPEQREDVKRRFAPLRQKANEESLLASFDAKMIQRNRELVLNAVLPRLTPETRKLVDNYVENGYRFVDSDFAALAAAGDEQRELFGTLAMSLNPEVSNYGFAVTQKLHDAAWDVVWQSPGTLRRSVGTAVGSFVSGLFKTGSLSEAAALAGDAYTEFKKTRALRRQLLAPKVADYGFWGNSLLDSAAIVGYWAPQFLTAAVGKVARGVEAGANAAAKAAGISTAAGAATKAEGVLGKAGSVIGRAEFAIGSRLPRSVQTSLAVNGARLESLGSVFTPRRIRLAAYAIQEREQMLDRIIEDGGDATSIWAQTIATAASIGHAFVEEAQWEMFAGTGRLSVEAAKMDAYAKLVHAIPGRVGRKLAKGVVFTKGASEMAGWMATKIIGKDIAWSTFYEALEEGIQQGIEEVAVGTFSPKGLSVEQVLGESWRAFYSSAVPMLFTMGLGTARRAKGYSRGRFFAGAETGGQLVDSASLVRDWVEHRATNEKPGQTPNQALSQVAALYGAWSQSANEEERMKLFWGLGITDEQSVALGKTFAEISAAATPEQLTEMFGKGAVARDVQDILSSDERLKGLRVERNEDGSESLVRDLTMPNGTVVTLRVNGVRSQKVASLDRADESSYSSAREWFLAVPSRAVAAMDKTGIDFTKTLGENLAAFGGDKEALNTAFLKAVKGLQIRGDTKNVRVGKDKDGRTVVDADIVIANSAAEETAYHEYGHAIQSALQDAGEMTQEQIDAFVEDLGVPQTSAEKWNQERGSVGAEALADRTGEKKPGMLASLARMLGIRAAVKEAAPKIENAMDILLLAYKTGKFDGFAERSAAQERIRSERKKEAADEADRTAETSEPAGAETTAGSEEEAPKESEKKKSDSDAAALDKFETNQPMTREEMAVVDRRLNLPEIEVARAVMEGGWRYDQATGMWTHIPELQGQRVDFSDRFFGPDGEWHEPAAERHQIVGEFGSDWLGVGNATEAKRLEESGSDRETIWKQTGWWKGDDGKWRVEIPDIQRAEFDELLGELRDALKRSPRVDKDGHEYVGRKISKLAERSPWLRRVILAYPSLGDVLFFVRPTETTPRGYLGQTAFRREGEDGAVAPYFIEIGIGSRSNDSVYATFVHEIQHVIQAFENFPNGSAGGTAVSEGDQTGGMAGETEARLAETRIEMSPEERSETPPWETERLMLERAKETGDNWALMTEYREKRTAAHEAGRYSVSPDFAQDGTVVDALPAHLREDGRAIVAERANTPAWMADTDGTPTDLSERDWLRREAERRHSISGIYTGSGADYADRDWSGEIIDGPSLLRVGSSLNGSVYGWGLYGIRRKGSADRYGRNLYKQTFFTDRPKGDLSHLLDFDPGGTITPEQAGWIGAELEKENIAGVDIKADMSAETAYYRIARAFGGDKEAASLFLARAGIDGVMADRDERRKGAMPNILVSFRDDNIRVDHKWVDGVQRYSVTPAEDAAYMDAVQSGDMDAAQRMVREAAEKAGYRYRGFHGTPFGGWTKYDLGREGLVSGVGRGLISLTTSREDAEAYSQGDSAAAVDDLMRRVNAVLAEIPDDAWERTEVGGRMEYDANAFYDYASQFMDQLERDDFDSDEEYQAAEKTNERNGYIQGMQQSLEGFKRDLPEYWAVFDKALAELGTVNEQTPEVKDLLVRIEDPFVADANPETYGAAALAAENAIHDGKNDGAILHLANGTDRIFVPTPSQIKSADPVTYDDAGNVIPLSQRFDPENEDIRYQISGPVGAEALGIRGLADAEAMERSGADRLAIWRETGWWRGRDGEWRVEVPDFELNADAPRMLLASGTARLSDLIPAGSAILKAYPSLGKMRIDVVESQSFSGRNNGISIDIDRGELSSPDKLRSTLAHEIQHSLQTIEGFARGGSWDEQVAGRDANTLRRLTRERNTLKRILAAIEDQQPPSLYEFQMQRLGVSWNYSVVRNALDEKNREIREMRKSGVRSTIGKTGYNNLAGEAEARLVEKRLGMTPEERAARPPWEDFDVAESEQIVRGVEQSLPKIVRESPSYDGIDADTDAPRFSIATYEQGGRDVLAAYLAASVKKGDLSRADADDILRETDFVAGIAKRFEKDKRFRDFGAWSKAVVETDDEGRPMFGVVRSNGDYAMNIDFSTVCKKRRPMDRIFARLVRDGILTGANVNELSGEAVAGIQGIIKAHGLEVACALCFVDAKRYRLGEVAKRFADGGRTSEGKSFDGWNRLVAMQADGGRKWADRVKKAKGKTDFESRCVRAIESDPSVRVRVEGSQLVSSEGMDALAKNAPGVYELWRTYGGTNNAKDSHWDAPYNNDVIRPFKSRTNPDGYQFDPKKAFAIGGVRLQSFSDFVGRMFFDYVQMFAELAAKKLPLHVYTKEPNFVKLFHLTNAKINMSLVPAVVDGGVAPGLDADGNYAWADECFPPDEAFALRKLGGNVGTIAVGVSDEHIRKLLRDPTIDMVIPYHKSGINPVVASIRKINQFKDYSKVQNTMNAKRTAYKGKEHFDFYGSLAKTKNPKKTAREYVAWCKERNLLPKFDAFANEENYYKLLEDFRLYDENGKYAPQQAVRQKYPENLGELVEASLRLNQDEETAYLENEDAIVAEIEASILGPRMAEAENAAGDVARHSVVSSLSAFDPGRLPQSMRWGTVNGNEGNLTGIVAMCEATGRRISDAEITEIANRLGVDIPAPDLRRKARELAESEIGAFALSSAMDGDVSKGVAVLAAAAEPKSDVKRLVKEAWKSGAKRGMAVDAMRRRITAAVLAEQRGANLADIVREFGFDIARIMHSWRNEAERRDIAGDVTPLPDPYATAGAVEDPDGTKAQEAEARLAAARADASKRFQSLFAEARRLEEARKEADGETGEETGAAAGNSDDGAEEDDPGDLEEPLRPETLPIPWELLQQTGLDIGDAPTFSLALRVGIRDMIWRADPEHTQPFGAGLEGEALDEADERFWRNPTALDQYRKSMVSILLDTAGKLLDHQSVAYRRAREGALQITRDGTADRIEQDTADVLRQISTESIKQTTRSIVSELMHDLRKGFIDKKTTLDSDFVRKQTGEVSKRAKWIHKVLGMTERQVEEEYDKLEQEIARREQLYDNAVKKDNATALDVGEDQRYREALWKKADLEEYGLTRYLLPGEAKEKCDAIRSWMNEEAADWARRLVEFETRMERERKVVIDAVANRRADGSDIVHEKDRASDARYLRWVNTLDQRLRDIFRFSKGADAAAADALRDEWGVKVARATEVYETRMQRQREAFERAVLDIVGAKGASAWLDHMEEEIPEEQAAFLSKHGRRLMTYGQVLHLYGYLCQTGDYAGNIERYGRQGQLEYIERNVLSREDIAIFSKMRDIYADSRDEISDAKREQTGIGFGTPDPFYAPVKVETPRRSGAPVEASTWNLMPEVFTERRRHTLDVDETADAISLFWDRAEQSSRMIAYGQLGVEMLHTLCDGKVKAAIERYHGRRTLNALLAHVGDTLAGGHSVPGAYRGEEVKTLNFMRSALTKIALCGNLVPALKQTVSAPVFALSRETGMWSVVKDVGMVGSDEWKKALREWSESDAHKARYGAGGIMGEIKDAMLSGRGTKSRWQRLVALGFTPIQIGDSVPSLLVGVSMYMAERDRLVAGGMNYEDAKREAATRSFMHTETTQQSSRVENLPEIVRRGDAGVRLFTMFMSSPMLQLSWQSQRAREMRAAVDPEGKHDLVWCLAHAHENEKALHARKKFVEAMIVNHLYMPAAMGLMSIIFHALLGRRPDEKDAAAIFSAMVLGPFGAIIGASYAISMLVGIASEGKGYLFGRGGKSIAPSVFQTFDRLLSKGLVTAYDLATLDLEAALKDADGFARSAVSPYRHAREAIDNYSE